MDAAARAREDETTIREDTQRIGKFALIERLGKGNSGTVFKALDTFTGNEVALKVLDASLFQGDGINEMSRPATVETLTDSLIAEFRPSSMKKLSLNCQLQLSQSLLNTVVDRLAFADERIAHA